jgi:hypothetical protein
MHKFYEALVGVRSWLQPKENLNILHITYVHVSSSEYGRKLQNLVLIFSEKSTKRRLSLDPHNDKLR